MPDLQYEVATATAQLVSNKIWGWNVTETAGAAAEVQILDGAAGAIIWDHKLNAGQSVTVALPFPIALRSGLGAQWQVISGTVRGAIYGIPAPR